MRLLHVSDWHLGATLGRVTRTPDHERVLEETVAIAADWQPHAIAHSGDLFDATRPPMEAMQLAADTLGRLSAVAPTVVIAGNHDSRALFRVLNTFQSVGAQRSLWFVTEPSVLTFPGEDGEQLRLACMPFLHPNTLVDLLADDPTSWTGAYADGVRVLNRQLQATLEDDYTADRDVLVYAAHLHVHDAELAGTERRVHVSEDYATHTESLPPVSYAAFGHIHRPQKLPTTALTGRYAGSPLPLDFGEYGEAKSVVTVELTPGGAANVDTVGLSGGRRLVAFDGSWADFCAQADQIGDGILKAVIETEQPDPELADKAAEQCPQASIFEIANRVTSSLERPLRESDDGEGEEDLADLFREYAADQNLQHATAARVAELFDAAMAGVAAEQPADFGLADLLHDPTEEAG